MKNNKKSAKTRLFSSASEYMVLIIVGIGIVFYVITEALKALK